MKIDIWSDVVCPFCYVGKRHLEQALEQFAHRDAVEVVWHSFELDPDAETTPDGNVVDLVSRKYGMSREQAEASQRQIAQMAAAAGLDFQWQRCRPGNTFDAHRLLHLAASHGLGDAAQERLLRGYFTEGEAVGDPETLVRLATEIGLADREVRDVLESGRFADDVRADEAQAAAYGIRGVPFFVLDERLGVSGAQPVEVFAQALTQAWESRSPLTLVAGGSGAPVCADDSCAT